MVNLNWQLPLWKMKISDEQYSDLKKELRDAFFSENLHKKQNLSREATLYYAEWWRREYNGGKSSKQSVAASLNLQTSDSDELYKFAKKGAKSLDIDPIVVISNKLWFRALLIQGGLPMQHIQCNKENIIGYKNFLKGLIRYTNSVNVNWYDSSFIESLQCVDYLPASFRNESIYELSLQIARAIFDDNDDLLPYETTQTDWSELTDELKNEKQSSRKNSKHAVPFNLRWRVKKTENNLQLIYTVESGNKISDLYIQDIQNTHKKDLSNSNSFSLFVQNQRIATYVKTKNGDYSCREPKFISFIWNEETVISLQIQTDTNLIIDITAPNSFAPDLENPFLIVKSEGSDESWDLKQTVSDTNINAVVFTDEWYCQMQQDNEQKNVELAGRNLYLQEFSGTISLKNKETDEDVKFDNSISHYTCEFAGWTIDWIQNANYKILTHEKPDIRLYNEINERVKTGCIYYREYRGRTWNKYQMNSLPIGLLEFKIELPDGKFLKEKFYYTGSLNCIFDNMTSNSGEISLEWCNGRISPQTNQLGIEIDNLTNSSWKISRQTNNDAYPELSKFILLPLPNPSNSPVLEISIASPFKGVVLLDSFSNEIPNEKVLCLSSLYGYRYIVMGHKKVPAKIFHTQNDISEIESQLEQGIHSLSRFEDSILSMFSLHGSDTFEIESKVRVVIGQGGSNKMIEIKEYNVYTTENNGAILVVDNREDSNIIDFNNKLFALAVDCPCEDIRVVELDKRNNEFIFNENDSLNKFIVFSNKLDPNFSKYQVVPRFFDFSRTKNETANFEENELTPQKININNLREALETTSPTSEEWKKVIFYFNIINQHRLPFKTLNCFRAIAQSPLLMAKMVNVLSQSSKVIESNFLEGLTRFEGELGVAFHWISYNYWDSSIEWYVNELPTIIFASVIENIFEKRKLLLTYTLNSVSENDLELLLCKSTKANILTQPPTKFQVQEYQSKLGSNSNQPNNLVIIPDDWMFLFPNAKSKDLNIYVKAFLISPVKAALSLTGKEDSLWDENNLKMRRTMNFYRQFRPTEYSEILICMVKQIKQIKSN